MAETVALTFYWLLIAYASAGVVFAGVFLMRGIALVDPSTSRPGRVFRILITPGLVALRPTQFFRWQRVRVGGPGPLEHPDPEWSRTKM